MSQLANCPVCTAQIEIEADDSGNKVECGHCKSLHRVLDDLSLKILIESLDFAPLAEAEVTAEEVAVTVSSAPKLVSRRERMREQRAAALAAGEGRRATVGRSRRR
jgi:hypothetical protein